MANNNSTPCTPYQNKSGCVFSMIAGLKVSAPNTFPILPALTSVIPVINLKDEEENTGVLYLLAA